MYLDKDKFKHKRNSDGNLLPIDVVLEKVEGKPTIKIKPMTRGDIAEFQAMDPGKADTMVVTKHCLEPSFTEDEVNDLQTYVANQIAIAIMAASVGMSSDSLSKEIGADTNQFPAGYIEKKQQ